MFEKGVKLGKDFDEAFQERGAGRKKVNLSINELRGCCLEVPDEVPDEVKKDEEER